MRALLVAWVLQERLAAGWSAALPTTPDRPLSRWRLAHLGLTTLAQAVRGTGTLDRLQACLPRLTRVLLAPPRCRPQQAATVDAWLLDHPGRLVLPDVVAG